MVYQTTASLFMTSSVRVRLIGTNAETSDRALTVEFPGGTELRFLGPKEKLLRLFRGIETSLIEDDPDNDIFLDEDKVEVQDGLWDDLDGVDA